MSQRNETTTLVFSLVIVLLIIAALAWWMTERLKDKLDVNIALPSSSPSSLNGGTTTETPTPIALPSTSIVRFSQVPRVPSGKFNYGGSTTWAPIRAIVDTEIQKALPVFQLLYTHPNAGSNETPGSSTGIRMLLRSELHFSQSSRQLKSEEKQQELKEIPVAIDGIVFAVHPTLNMPGLTLDQVKDIYTGKITNWNQVGGPNLKITPYSRRVQDGGTVEFFVEKFLHEQSMGANVEFAADTTTGLGKVAATLGGIYYASAPEVVAQCKVKPLPIGFTADNLIPPYQPPLVRSEDCPRYRNQLNGEVFRNGKYPNTRQLYAIVKQNAQIEQQAGEAYANLLLTDEGQQLIEKAGFVRIR